MSSPFNELRVLIVADDPLARAGLAALVADWPGCTVAGQTSGEGDLSDELVFYRPDVLVWDLDWEPARALDICCEQAGPEGSSGKDAPVGKGLEGDCLEVPAPLLAVSSRNQGADRRKELVL